MAIVVVADRRRRPLRSVRSDVVEAVDLSCEIGYGVDAGVDDPDLDPRIAHREVEGAAEVRRRELPFVRKFVLGSMFCTSGSLVMLDRPRGGGTGET